MEIYRDTNHDSGVYAYETGDGYIDVLFRGSSRIYRYSYDSAGRENVESMKTLAAIGTGLNSYINRNAAYLYE